MKSPVYFLLLAALGGAILGNWLTSIPPAKTFDRAAPDFRLPQKNDSRGVEEAYSQLRDYLKVKQVQKEIDSAGTSVTEAPVRIIDWRFLGTVINERARYALIESEGKIGRYEVGDALPGESLLVSVAEDRIGVQVDKETQNHRIFEGRVDAKDTNKSASSREERSQGTESRVGSGSTDGEKASSSGVRLKYWYEKP